MKLNHGCYINTKLYDIHKFGLINSSVYISSLHDTVRSVCYKVSVGTVTYAYACTNRVETSMCTYHTVAEILWNHLCWDHC